MLHKSLMNTGLRTQLNCQDKWLSLNLKFWISASCTSQKNVIFHTSDMIYKYE
jgi:hypothetical protein